MCSLRFENNLLTIEGVRFASISKKTPLSKLSFAFVSLALPLLDMRTALAPHLSQRSAADRGPNILEQLSAEKQWVGGEVCVLHSPLITNSD